MTAQPLFDGQLTRKPAYRYRHWLQASFLLLSCGLWGCVSTQPANGGADKDMGCVSGDCQNGYGVFHQREGKYVRSSEGTFSKGKLQQGKVNLLLGNTDDLLIEEVEEGKIVWKRSYGH